MQLHYMSGNSQTLTPCQVDRNSCHHWRSRWNSAFNRMGWSRRRRQHRGSIIRRRKVRPQLTPTGHTIFAVCWRWTLLMTPAAFESAMNLSTPVKPPVFPLAGGHRGPSNPAQCSTLQAEWKAQHTRMQRKAQLFKDRHGSMQIERTLSWVRRSRGYKVTEKVHQVWQMMSVQQDSFYHVYDWIKNIRGGIIEGQREGLNQQSTCPAISSPEENNQPGSQQYCGMLPHQILPWEPQAHT